MKKIISLIMVIASITLIFASCGANNSYSLYKSAEEKLDALTKYEADVTLDLTCDLGKETGSFHTITKTTQKVDLESSKYVRDIEYSMPEENMSNAITKSHADNMTYYSDSIECYKFDEDNASAMAPFTTIAGFDFGEEVFKKAKSDVKDDVTTITTDTNASDVVAMAKTFLMGANNLTGTENDYSIKSINLVLKIKNDMLVCVSLDYSATFSFGKEEASASVKLEMNYSECKDEIVLQAGTADYPYSSGSGDNIDEALSDQDALAIEAAFALFEEDHVTKVANYDELYAQACETYGKAQIDSIIEVILAFNNVSK